MVKGRNVEVPDHYREHVANKLTKVTKLDRKIINIDVELLHERNPRQHDHCQRVEITCHTVGAVVRAEASARDFYSALDEAIERLSTRLRRVVDRRRIHHRPGRPLVSVAEATAKLPTDLPAAEELTEAESAEVTAEPERQPWRIVREKEHPGTPMTVDDALFQMELLGHDFYLFMDKESGRPSVVYRRRAYDYGVISLAPPTA